jgi:N6-adenosine-specific RNA methylase IME4
LSLWKNLPEGPFDLAYMDPPWRWKTRSPAGDGKPPPYARLDFTSLQTFPLPDLMERNSAVVSWVIDTHIPQMLELARWWGLRYSTVCFTWAKLTKTGQRWHFGTGKTTRANTEQCFLFWYGKGLPIRDHSVRRLIVAPVREHSRKPDEARAGLMKLFGDVRRVELFANEKTPGWEAWGDGHKHRTTP